MAGFFGTYSANVALATSTYEGALYAVVQSSLNRNVRHALFFAFFFLPPIWCALTLMLDWRRREAWGWWLLVAGVLYAFAVILFTHQVNLPLNAYTESWDPANLPSDWARTRQQWNLANAWRSFASAVAFLAALISLALVRRHGDRPILIDHSRS
ncbi:anthrone oxygenase family protein [Streptococcus pyogenes]|uniref:anthrone oxygenase family protein n=1 Tax=Streptococcus pyogenes TaxID=1314 RepID=UPI003DA0AC82